MKPLSILTIIATTALLTAGCSGPSKTSDQSTKLQLIPQGSLSDGHFLGDIYESPDISGRQIVNLLSLQDFNHKTFMERHARQAPDRRTTWTIATTNGLNLLLKNLFQLRSDTAGMVVASVTLSNVVNYTLPSDVFDTEIHPRFRWDSATDLTGKYYVAKLVQASEGVLTLTNASSTGGGIDTDRALNGLASGGVKLTKQDEQNYHFKLKAPTFIYYQMERIAKDAPQALKDIPSGAKAFYYNWENSLYTTNHRRFGAHVNIHTKVWLSITDTQIVVNAQSDANGGKPGEEARIRLEVENGISKESIPFTLPGHLTRAALYKPVTNLTELKAVSVIPSRPFIRNQNDQRDIHVTGNGPVANWASFNPFEVEGDTGGPRPGFTVQLTPLVIKAQIVAGK